MFTLIEFQFIMADEPDDNDNHRVIVDNIENKKMKNTMDFCLTCVLS